LKKRVKGLKAETYALFLAYKDPRTPWYAKIVLLIVIGYALSPIDLIPDFIPVIGSLDDLILVPLGIAVAIRLIPRNVLRECREKAKERFHVPQKKSRTAAIIVILFWLFIIYLLYRIIRWIVS